MYCSTSSRHFKSRELRTRVLLAARMRADAGWSDACILNVSSRGLLISSSQVGALGSIVELRQDMHVIVAHVVWRNGSRAGLRADDRIPVEQIVTTAQASTLRLTAAPWPTADRRTRPRTHEESRLHSRALEFASVAVIALSLAATLFSMVEQAFARPLALVQTALGG